MRLIKHSLALALGLAFLLSACSLNTASPEPSQPISTAPGLENPTLAPSPPAPTSQPTPSPTPEPLRLTVCLGSEPSSLFPYTAAGRAAQTVLALLYDRSFGPGEHLNNQIPVILEQLPSLDNGGMRLEPVTVNPGDPIVDSTGTLATLSEGALYRPAGCTQRSCELIYAGSASIQMNQWVLVYTLKPTITWSDGAPLTAADSRYAYQAAQALFPAVQGDLLSRTAAYTALDERTLEWRGLPGYQDGDAAGKFFPPLPAHAWGDLPLAELPANELASRQPLSWGAYMLSQWLPGEMLTLERNPFYFLAAEALPAYDQIEVRFVPKTNDSGPALLAEGCDVIDPFVGELPAGAQVRREPASWTLLLFGVSPADASRPSPFSSQAVRQAAAACIDRTAAARAANGVLAQAYVPADSPYFAPQAVPAAYDPAAAASLLTNAGWVDADNDPATPRTALGAPGFAADAPLALSLFVSPDAAQQAAAQVVQQGLASCGFQVTLETLPPAEYLAAGPSGPVFGRSFDLALFAFPAADLPPCRLFLSREIPGEPPASARGWGGANAAGYASPAFDRACTSALTALPGDSALLQDFAQAQSLLEQDLPFLPLYWQEWVVVANMDWFEQAQPAQTNP